MYEDLVKRLRFAAIAADSGNEIGESFYADIMRAADAIENLNRRETPMKITEIHVDEYYCPACGAENNCDQGYVQDVYCPVCGQRLLPEPPKEETE